MPTGKPDDMMTAWSRRLAYAGIFLIPYTRIRGGGIQVSDLIFVIAIIVLAFSKRRAKIGPMAVAWHFAIFIIVIGGIGASVNAVSPSASILVIARMVFVILFWPWVIRHVLVEERLKHQAMYAFVLGCAVSGAVEVLQTKFHVLILPVVGSTTGRATAFTIQPNELGACLALGITFAVGLTLQLGAGRYFHRIVSVGLIAIGLILSGSVSSMFAALAGCLVLLIRRRVSLRTVLVTLVAIVVIYMGGTSLLGSNSKSLNPIARFEQTVGNGQSSNTGSARISTDKGAWHGIVDDPVFGHGLDQTSSIVYWDPYLGVPYQTHNFVLMIWFQGGLLFLLGCLVAIISAFRRVSGVRRRDPTRDIIFSGAIASLIYSMTAPVIFQTWFWLPFVLAMTYSLTRTPAQTQRSAERPASAGNRHVNARAGRVTALSVPGSGS